MAAGTESGYVFGALSADLDYGAGVPFQGKGPVHCRLDVINNTQLLDFGQEPGPAAAHRAPGHVGAGTAPGQPPQGLQQDISYIALVGLVMVTHDTGVFIDKRKLDCRGTYVHAKT